MNCLKPRKQFFWLKISIKPETPLFVLLYVLYFQGQTDERNPQRPEAGYLLLTPPHPHSKLPLPPTSSAHTEVCLLFLYCIDLFHVICFSILHQDFFVNLFFQLFDLWFFHVNSVKSLI